MLYEWFIEPVIKGNGYNVFNTIVYAVLLLVSVFFVAKLLKTARVRADKKLWKGIIPFVILAGALRALQDHNFFVSLGFFQYFFVTPLIYFLVFFLAFFCILLSKKVGREFVFFAGWFLAVVFLTQAILRANDFMPLILVVSLAAFVFLTAYLFVKFFNPTLLNSLENKSVLLGQTLDACSSAIAILVVGGFSEQHVLPNFLFSFIPFYLFIPLKIFIALFALYAIDKGVKDSSIAWTLKLTVFAVGAGPGIRNALTMIMD